MSEVVRSGTGEVYDGDRAMLSSLQRLAFVGELMRGRAPKIPHYTAETLPTADASQRYAVAVLSADAAPDDAVICLLTAVAPETYEWVSFGLLSALTLTSLLVTTLEVDGDLNHDGSNVGFFGVTPTTRPGATADIKDALTLLGLLQGTSATPLNLDGGALTAGAILGSSVNSSGALGASGLMTANAGFQHLASTLLFWAGTGYASKPTVSGSRGGNAALASLLTVLATYGLITDGSSA